MKKRSILAIAMAVVLCSSIMIGCAKSGGDNSSQGSSEPPKKAASGQLTAVYDKVIAEIFGEEGPSFAKIEDATQIEEMFGVTADMAKESMIQQPMMNVNVDTFVGFEAKEGQAEAIATKLNAYKDKVIADREAFPYLPDHLPKAKAAQVITIDDYVFYLSLGNISQDVEEGDLQKAADAEVQKAVDAVKGVLTK